MKEHKQIDILINNAAIAKVKYIEDLTIEEVKHVHDVNLIAYVSLVKKVWP